MRAVIYARYSSDLQSASSIEDQVRLCRERVDKEGWAYLHAYHDRAISGTSNLRPGYQKQDARCGTFDVVVAEALDRLSRDQEHVAHLFKHLSFAGVQLLTLSEGVISELHVGLSGTMGALYVKHLAEETHRGLRGRIEAGKSGGGLTYGYDVVRTPKADGTVEVGDEAAVVRRIFEAYASGMPPRKIAWMLIRRPSPAASARLGGIQHTATPSAVSASSTTGSMSASSSGTSSNT